MLYIVDIEEGTIITHDGHVEVGIFHTTLEKFVSMVKVEYQIVYWKPDPLGCRYPRVNFQRTDKVAGKMALEQSINEWQRRGNL